MGQVTGYVPLAAADGLLYTVNGPLFTQELVELITDRTEADVDRANKLLAKGLNKMSLDELHEFLGVLRGAYSSVDLNRVTSVMAALNVLFEEYGYATGYADVYITHRDGTSDTIWRDNDEESRAAKLEAYRVNVLKLRSTLPMLEETPNVPGAMSNITWTEANAIEQILADIDFLLNNMAAAWFYSGDLYLGEA